MTSKSLSSPTQFPFFGEGIPSGDPSDLQSFHSPYYNESHRRFRTAIREFVEREILPYTTEWDESKSLPKDLHEKIASAGILAGTIGNYWPTQYAGTYIAGGISPSEFDAFHGMIIGDEFSRCCSGGVQGGCFIGISVGLPPILNFGSEELKNKYAKILLSGKKKIALAITEPNCGSDVASLITSAVKSSDGKHYIVNGTKKWITNGTFADCMTVAVRTGGEGAAGVSLLVVDRSEGVTTRQMDCSGMWGSGTAFVTFEDVRVPVSNLIGQEGSGFKYIVSNFNHERIGLITSIIRMSRCCYEDAFRYAFKRKTFGKFLFEHPVIRSKLGNMAMRIDATHALLEHIVYQTTKMSHKEQTQILGGKIALLKAQATQTLLYTALEAAQCMGGIAYTRGGQGEKVERACREIVGNRVPGGSEEIMIELGMKQAAKEYLLRKQEIIKSKI